MLGVDSGRRSCLLFGGEWIEVVSMVVGGGELAIF